MAPKAPSPGRGSVPPTNQTSAYDVQELGTDPNVGHPQVDPHSTPIGINQPGYKPDKWGDQSSESGYGIGGKVG